MGIISSLYNGGIFVGQERPEMEQRFVTGFKMGAQFEREVNS